jgi:hypothetical protein
VDAGAAATDAVSLLAAGSAAGAESTEAVSLLAAGSAAGAESTEAVSLLATESAEAGAESAGADSATTVSGACGGGVSSAKAVVGRHNESNKVSKTTIEKTGRFWVSKARLLLYYKFIFMSIFFVQ